MVNKKIWIAGCLFLIGLEIILGVEGHGIRNSLLLSTYPILFVYSLFGYFGFVFSAFIFTVLYFFTKELGINQFRNYSLVSAFLITSASFSYLLANMGWDAFSSWLIWSNFIFFVITILLIGVKNGFVNERKALVNLVLVIWSLSLVFPVLS